MKSLKNFYKSFSVIYKKNSNKIIRLSTRTNLILGIFFKIYKAFDIKNNG